MKKLLNIFSRKQSVTELPVHEQHMIAEKARADHLRTRMSHAQYSVVQYNSFR